MDLESNFGGWHNANVIVRLPFRGVREMLDLLKVLRMKMGFGRPGVCSQADTPSACVFLFGDLSTDVSLWSLWPQRSSEQYGSFRWDVSGSCLNRRLGRCGHCSKLQKLFLEDNKLTPTTTAAAQ